MSSTLDGGTTATNYYPTTTTYKIKVRLDIEGIIRSSYYDLIELPSGSHIPVPIAIRLLKKEKLIWKLLRLITRKKKRNNNFYKCLLCKQGSFFAYDGLICSDCDWHLEQELCYNSDDEDLLFRYDWLQEKVKSKRVSDSMKVKAFLEIVKNNQFWKLKYVESERKKYHPEVYEK